MYVEFFFFFFFFFVWNYYFISARWLPPLRINKVKVKSKSKTWPRPAGQLGQGETIRAVTSTVGSVKMVNFVTWLGG